LALKNNRPINDHKLQQALNAVQATMAKYGFAGAVMLVAEEEAAFGYVMNAPWSAIRPDADNPLGFRIRANSAEDGAALTRKRVEGAVHTLCQLSDFGSQTMDWMEQAKAMLRSSGIDFDHTPFGGKPLPSMVVEKRRQEDQQE
jgi:hypothetical protein